MYLFFHTTPTPQIYTLSLHDALPILSRRRRPGDAARPSGHPGGPAPAAGAGRARRLAAELDRRLQLAQDRRDDRTDAQRLLDDGVEIRSEERRVGKECRSGGWA